jgi:spore maturation protein CgeB
MTRPRIAFYASSLVSAYWNGAATYYRGIVRALHDTGYDVTFYEPDAYERQRHRDIDDPPWARVVVYPADADGLESALKGARNAAIVIKASGVGVFDAELESGVLAHKSREAIAIYWDVDAPATLDRLAGGLDPGLAAAIPAYDLVLTYGGGDRVVQAYEAMGARRCVPVYNALDPTTHHPVAPDPRFQGDLGFLGNRLPDREERVESFFLAAAARLGDRRFVLGGNGWHDKTMTPNVHYVGHVYTADHNAFNCTPRAVLNISRTSMAKVGFSPATRVFEAAGAGACLITDRWDGIERFLEPGREVLVASDGGELADLLASLSPQRARDIGAAARRRVLGEHTYSHRVAALEQLLGTHAKALPS